MATAPQPDPTQNGGAGAPPDTSPQAGPPSGGPGGGAPPSQAPANPTQIMLAKLYQACKALAAQNPVLSSGLAKAAQGIQEAQTAMLTTPQPQPAQSNPQY